MALNNNSLSRQLRNSLKSFFLAALFSLGACCKRPPIYKAVGNTNSLEAIQNLHAVPVSVNKTTPALRQNALQDMAMSTAAQQALSHRSKQINETLNHHAAELDRIYNFNLMLLEHNVLPPVLVQANRAMNLEDSQAIRIADKTYEIIAQAQFVSTPPNWRNYLIMHYKKPEKPLPDFLPKTPVERVIWRQYAKIGWENGLDQAKAIHAENLSRLKRDYQGMLLYRSLLDQGMISRPYVAQVDLGVTGDDSHLRINDQILRITASPALQTNPKQWKPIIIRDDTESIKK